MSRPARWLGIDLFKGVAAYGVVVIHSLGQVAWTPSNGRFVGMFVATVVPFFLAVALYFSTARLLSSGSAGHLRDRARRLLVPYFLWSLIYLAARTGLYMASGRADDVRAMFGRPLDLVFLGLSSAQLYFLPLLFLGELEATLAIRALGSHLHRPATVGLIAGMALLLAWYHPLRYSPLLTDPCRAPSAHVLINLANYAILCVPFVAGAILFHLARVQRLADWLTPIGGVALVVVLVLLDLVSQFPFLDSALPPPVREVAFAFGFLLAAMAISPAIPAVRWVASLGASAMGIYLVHPLAIEFLELLLVRGRFTQAVVITPAHHAIFAAVAFLLSWTVVVQFLRAPALSRILFGQKAP